MRVAASITRKVSFISTTTVFGTPLDITLAELAIEAFLPADPETTRKLMASIPGEPGILRGA
jgi:hypothetical protein